MGSSVVVVRKLLWAMRRRTVVVLMATVGGVVLLVGGMALANTPPPDPGPGSTHHADFLALAYTPSIHHSDAGEVAFAGWSSTRAQAKEVAYNECVRRSKSKSEYKDDCRGIAWVRDGWLAFAIEDFRPFPSGYKPSWGWAIAQTRNSAKGRAVEQCYAGDPKYEDCVISVTYVTNGAGDPPNKFDGGPWFNP